MRAPLVLFGSAALMASMAVIAPVAAADNRSLTLEEAIRMGLSNNPMLASERSSADAADQNALAARAIRWPRVTAEATLRRSDQQVVVFGDKLTAGEFTASDFLLEHLNNPDAENHLAAALAISAPLYSSGRIQWGIESARDEAASARAMTTAAESDLVAEITGAYFGISVADAAVMITEQALADAGRHEEVALARYEAGASLKSDQLRARVFRLGRQRELERRRADLSLARSRLARLITLPPDESIDPATPLETPSRQIGPLAEWTALALARSPLLAASRSLAGAADSGAHGARASLGPEVNGFARYERNSDGLGTGEGAYLFGVALQWTAFDRARPARIAGALAVSTAAGARLRAVEDQVGLDVERAWHDVQVADMTLLLSREAVAAAVEARRITADRYVGGLLPLTDLLDVETELLNARHQELVSMFDAVVGRVRLEHVTGSLEVSR